MSLFIFSDISLPICIPICMFVSLFIFGTLSEMTEIPISNHSSTAHMLHDRNYLPKWQHRSPNNTPWMCCNKNIINLVFALGSWYKGSALLLCMKLWYTAICFNKWMIVKIQHTAYVTLEQYWCHREVARPCAVFIYDKFREIYTEIAQILGHALLCNPGIRLDCMSPFWICVFLYMFWLKINTSGSFLISIN